MSHRTLLCLVVLATPAVSQGNFLVVDAAQGPGWNYTDIPPAVQAAQTGDVILVRPGSYNSFSIDNKGIAVIGQPGARVRAAFFPSFGTLFDVRNIATGQTVTISGLTEDPTIDAKIVIEDCQGSVQLQEVSMVTDASSLEISSCAQTMLQGCPLGLVSITDSTVSMADCTLRDRVFPQGFSYAMTVTGSDVWLSRCDITGGFVRVTPLPAILMSSSVVSITDDGSHLIRGGRPGSLIGQTPAISGTGTARIDPKVVLQSVGGAPLVESTVKVETVSIPSLSADGFEIGGTRTLDLVANPGDGYFMLLALPGTPISFPQYGGATWLHLPSAVLGPFGTIGASGRELHTFAVPPAPAIVGLRVHWQALAGDGTTFQLSNPVGYAYTL